ncbi:hypothetical protein ASD54_21840 [Rhizobium sp. Root149]|uniref:NIPSNAP family protein n=1 Tax=Rhizobium sp. Root149 TaxID=1736473 RepID=UPI000714DBB2|nr:NIPSNAP family protein [Rhizobium sp. Root149]KQZ46656.1 hypothetical protein ASD54_21840 [Rhizobium sp. Root149]
MNTSDDSLYELRIYAIAPGRLEDMARRFRDDIKTLFPRHGIRIIGSWTCYSGPKMPAFVYLMRWKNFEERAAAFGSFVADPDWHEARERTNGPSELVEHYEIQFLRGLDTGELSEPMPLSAGETYELALHCAANGRAAAMRETLMKYDLAARSQAGAKVIGVFEGISGSRLPSLVSLVRWNDANQWLNAQSAIRDDARHVERIAEEIRVEGRSILAEADRYIMQPVEVHWDVRAL